MAGGFFVTPHALARYRQRVNRDGTEAEIVARLSATTRVRHLDGGGHSIEVRSKPRFRALVAPPKFDGGADVIVTIITGALNATDHHQGPAPERVRGVRPVVAGN